MILFKQPAAMHICLAEKFALWEEKKTWDKRLTSKANLSFTFKVKHDEHLMNTVIFDFVFCLLSLLPLPNLLLHTADQMAERRLLHFCYTYKKDKFKQTHTHTRTQTLLGIFVKQLNAGWLANR